MFTRPVPYSPDCLPPVRPDPLCRLLRSPYVGGCGPWGPRLLSPRALTAEGAVSPGDAGHAVALAGLHVGLDVVAEDGAHALVLAQVVQAVVEEKLRIDEGVAGLVLGRHDLQAQGAQALQFLDGAAGVQIRAVIWLAAVRGKEERGGKWRL